MTSAAASGDKRGRVDLEVVAADPVDDVELRRRLADRAVAPGPLPLHDHLERTADADEQHLVPGEAASRGRRPSPVEQDVVHDHRQAGVGERGDHPVQPVDQLPAELAGLDPERCVGTGLGVDVAEHLAPQGLVEVALGQGEHDRVDADPEPCAVEAGLERPHERGLAGARGSVEHDHATGRHLVMMAGSGRRWVAGRRPRATIGRDERQHRRPRHCPTTSASSSRRSRARSATRGARRSHPSRPTGGSSPPCARSWSRSARTRIARACARRPTASTGCTPS